MTSAFDIGTSLTLLGLLRRDPLDQAAWHTFVDRYGPRIYAWCRARGLHVHEAEDVTQIILVKLFKGLAAFTYTPGHRFRHWLHTVARHAYCDFLASRKELADDRVFELLHRVEARQDLLHRLGEVFDLELFEEACARVRLRTKDSNWQAFLLIHVGQLRAKDAANRLGMKVGAVSLAARRVQGKLIRELRRLERPDRHTRAPRHDRTPLPSAAQILSCEAIDCARA